MVETDAAMLAEAGHEVRRFGVVNPAGPGAAASLAVAPWNPRRTRELRRLLRTWRPDIAHVHNTWFSLSPAVVKTLVAAGVPTVVTFHNSRQLCVDGGFFRDGQMCTDCLGRLPLRGVARGCYRGSRLLSSTLAATTMLHRALGTWASADLITVPSAALRDLLVAGGFAGDQIAVTPWSTADPGGRKLPPSASDEVCFLGRLEPPKGVSGLLRAWEDAGDRLGGLRLTVIGSGELEAEVAAAGKGVTHRPWMNGDDVIRTMLAARALIVPSVCAEVFGFVAVEGMAAGLPVLASDRGALPETVGRVDPGLLVEAEDHGAWVTALTRLGDDDLVDRLGRRARALFDERFRPEHGQKRLLDVYDRVLTSAG